MIATSYVAQAGNQPKSNEGLALPKHVGFNCCKAKQGCPSAAQGKFVCLLPLSITKA
jgi:hypothetical protein